MTAPFTIARADSIDDIANARVLFREYHALVGVDLCFQGFEAEVNGLPGDYAPPSGRLFLASRDGTPIGCVALRAFDESRSELKRLFVRPVARGSGVGRALASLVLNEARAIGYSEVVLDTLPSMTEARKLYEEFEFREIPPYRSNPVQGARYLGKRLVPR